MKELIHYHCKENWGFILAAISGTAWIADLEHWINSAMATIVIALSIVLLYYKVGKRKAQKEKEQIELEFLRLHKDNEKFMMKWMNSRNKLKEPDTD